MSSSSGGSSEVGNSSSQLNGARSVLNGSLNGSGVFNGTSLSSNGVLTPATLSSSLLSSASTMPGVGGKCQTNLQYSNINSEIAV